MGNFKAFQEMGLGPADIETQSHKELFSIFWYIFFLTGLILFDQADKNTNR